MRFLDIIIPQYGETTQVVETALNSIARQKNVDFDEIGIFLINDHSKNQIKSTTLKKFPQLHITYLVNEKNIGPGLTRQRGIDLSEAEYITFLDADDEFYGENALRETLDLLNFNKCNALYTSIIREYKPYEEIEIEYIKPKDLISLHGLFLKRNWLVEKKIRFHSKLFYFEDTFFVELIQANRDVYVSDTLTYFWKYNERSMTRIKNNEINVNHFDDLLNCAIFVNDYFDSNSLEKNNFFVRQVIDSIIWLESNFFDSKQLIDGKEKYENKLYNVLKEYSCLFEDKKEIDYLYDNELDLIQSQYLYFESKYNFYDFVDYLDAKYKGNLKELINK